LSVKRGRNIHLGALILWNHLSADCTYAWYIYQARVPRPHLAVGGVGDARWRLRGQVGRYTPPFRRARCDSVLLHRGHLYFGYYAGEWAVRCVSRAESLESRVILLLLLLPIRQMSQVVIQVTLAEGSQEGELSLT
jgi:hypothetical protein